MSVIEALKSAQFVIDNQGHHTAVLLTVQAWECLIDWVEDVTDARIVTQAFAELQSVGGRPQKAGWLAWDGVREAWDDKEKPKIETVSV